MRTTIRSRILQPERLSRAVAVAAVVVVGGGAAAVVVVDGIRLQPCNSDSISEGELVIAMTTLLMPMLSHQNGNNQGPANRDLLSLLFLADAGCCS